MCSPSINGRMIRSARRKARHDYEYERNGVANLFMMFAPLEGWRCVDVTDRHAAVDYAHVLRDLSDKHFPNAAKIVLVQDNLSTHTPASLYAAFPATEARRLAERSKPQQTSRRGRLATHHQRRSPQAEIPIPAVPMTRATRSSADVRSTDVRLFVAAGSFPLSINVLRQFQFLDNLAQLVEARVPEPAIPFNPCRLFLQPA
ncbi:hypothetical protein FM996_13200 [Methylosinus sporium]|uniref:Tc1-like transposase DDE domain-containing protein n=1 Tax=Methylosinus sporium TaxID=428 RepID=A0A549SQ51_METSR|nr:hypothetical protein FM996_13200 [Methylosinus sporium]